MFNLFTCTAWGTSQSSKQILQLEDYLRLKIKIKNWHLFSEWDVTRQSACQGQDVVHMWLTSQR